MRNLKHATVGVFAGGLLTLVAAGHATAQVDSTERLDIGAVASELELDDETSRELSPMLDRLNAVIDRQQEHWQQGDQIRDEFADAYDQIAETLSASELREFHWLMRETAIGPRANRTMGRAMMGGRRGSRGNYGRGVRGYNGQRAQMRGMRGGRGWDNRPGWRPDGYDPKD